MIRSRVYRSGNLEVRDGQPERISDYLAEPDTVVWIDICEPTGQELQTVAAEVGINPLAVEDAVKGGQRPKVDRYHDHIFLSAYDVSLDVESGEFGTREVAAFVAERYLITTRRQPGFDIDEMLAAWDRSADLAKYGVGFLLYGLLDVLADGYLEVTDALDDAVDELEDRTFDEGARGRDLQLRSYRLRKSLVQLRRVLLPMREVLNSLMRRDSSMVEPGLVPFYQDVYDHVVRATEQSDTMRDLIATIFETNLTIQSNHTNEIMKKVTSYAAILAIPTAISGYYGMNVRTWPAAQTLVGGIVALVLIVGLSAGLFVAFRHNDWL